MNATLHLHQDDPLINFKSWDPECLNSYGAENIIFKKNLVNTMDADALDFVSLCIGYAK